MKRSGVKVMTKLITLVRPLTPFMLLAILMGVVGHLFASFITILGGFAVLNVLKLSNIGFHTIFSLILVFALLRGVLRYAEQASNHFIAFKLLALIRDKVFASLRRLAPAKLDGKDKGDLISIITSDIELLEVFYAHTISPIFIALIFCTVMVTFIGSFDPLLGLIASSAYFTTGVIIPICISHFTRDKGVALRKKSGSLSSFMLSSLRGLAEIMQYGEGEKRLKDIEKQTEEISKTEKQVKTLIGLNSGITGGVVLLFDIIMLLSSALLCGFSSSVICTLALISSFGPCLSLSSLGSTLQNTIASGNRVLDILEEEPVVEEVKGQKDVSFSGAQCKGIGFSYGKETIFNDFSLSIPKNNIIALIGKSGCGKSTLLKLLMRFWDVEKGKITVSKVDIEDINTTALRGMESLVTQETFLFHDTVFNNLKIAKLDATEEEVIKACKKASIHEHIISLPQGYNTMIGELGDTLSGGERQRLGLARAFLHNAPLMLLDEPTSNLDSLNEAIILKALDKEREGRTVVLVSHRRSTIGIADKVYNIEEGRAS